MRERVAEQRILSGELEIWREIIVRDYARCDIIKI